MRVPIATGLNIEKFSGGAVTRKFSGSINASYVQLPDGTVAATQRPGINIFVDASSTVSDAKGRGLYYWDAASATYFVNGDTVYKTGYGSPLAQTITDGTERVEIFEIGDYLVIIDTENNEGWYISSAADTTLVSIADVDFPPNQTPALTMTKGGAVLNGILYVGTTNGELWNSGSEDPTAWASADFTNAEVSPDNGVMIFNHSDHIAYLGTRSLQFFYDNANATGSPLNTRLDVFHEIGAADVNSHWVQMNSAYFVGQTPAGSLGVYVISNFGVNKISDGRFDSMLTQAIIVDSVKCMGSGLSSGGVSYYLLTLYTVDAGVVSPVATYVFSTQGIVGEWELMHTGLDKCPLIDWVKASATRAGEGMLTNGDIISMYDNVVPVDTVDAGGGYIADGYITDSYYSGSSDEGNNISMEIITGQGDSSSLQTKFADGLKVVCTPTDATQTIAVQWSDEGNNNYNTARNLDLSNPKNRLNRCGSYKVRNYKLTYAGSEQVEIEAIEVDVR